MTAANLGRTRARFGLHWPWYVWALPVAVPVAVALLVLLTGDALAAAISFVLIVLLASIPVLVILRSWAFRVTDRAIVIGPFLPGVSREVHLLEDIDLSTLRTWSNLGAYLTAAGTSGMATVGHVNRGSRDGISYRVARAGRLRGGRLEENALVADLGGTIELLSTPAGAARVAETIVRAAAEAGLPGADMALSTALPPGRLSPERGAHLREIPGHPAPRQARFEDLPPEMQARVRSHMDPR